MRVYIGLTLKELAEAVAQGGFGPPPIAAHAVTPALREWYAESDLEELEYAATLAAARTSLRKLREDPTTRPKRVVVAAEVPDSDVATSPDAMSAVEESFERVQPAATSGGTRQVEGDVADGGSVHTRSSVVIDVAVPMRRVAAVHIDGDDAEDAVRSAADAIAAADAGDDDAALTVEEAFEHELLWYAPQEIPQLLESSDHTL